MIDPQADIVVSREGMVPVSKAGLEALCDKIHKDCLPPGLKAGIDDAINKAVGHAKATAERLVKSEILDRVRRQCGGRKGVALSVEAYLGARQDGTLP